VNEVPSPGEKRVAEGHFAAASLNRMDLMGRNVDYPRHTHSNIVGPQSPYSDYYHVKYHTEENFPDSPSSPLATARDIKLTSSLFIFNSNAFELK